MKPPKECPILFSGPMVRAILEGRKSQTRRVMKPQPTFASQPRFVHGDGHSGRGWYCCEDEYPDEGSVFYRSPYGQPGDRLWVREKWTWCSGGAEVTKDAVTFGDGGQKFKSSGEYCSPQDSYAPGAFDHIKWKPSIHLPRWASRILLEVVDIRVESLQKISEGDAKREGVLLRASAESGRGLIDIGDKYSPVKYVPARAAGESLDQVLERAWKFRPHFAGLWDAINSGRGFGWEKNPWVWVVEFRRVQT